MGNNNFLLKLYTTPFLQRKPVMLDFNRPKLKTIMFRSAVPVCKTIKSQLTEINNFMLIDKTRYF